MRVRKAQLASANLSQTPTDRHPTEGEAEGQLGEDEPGGGVHEEGHVVPVEGRVRRAHTQPLPVRAQPRHRLRQPLLLGMQSWGRVGRHHLPYFMPSSRG